jgi:hypothetical protein
VNLYLYARNNPLTFVDPSGKFAVVLPIIGGAAVFTAAEAAAATFGVSVLTCLTIPACNAAMQQAIRDAVAGLGNTAMAVLRAACDAEYKAYKALEQTCGACNKQRADCIVDRFARCNQSLASLSCWQLALAARAAFVVSGCDYVPRKNGGPIRKENEGHIHQINQIFRNTLQNCFISIADNCLDLFDPLF